MRYDRKYRGNEGSMIVFEREIYWTKSGSFQRGIFDWEQKVRGERMEATSTGAVCRSKVNLMR